jgi:hypothetical protein
MTSTRSVLVIAGGILAVVLLAVVVVLLAEGREPPSYDPGTPEAAMQAYLAAWENDDPRGAYAFFSRAVQSAISEEEYVAGFDAFGQVGTNRAAFIDSVKGDESQVTIFLTVEEYYGDGPGESYTTQRSVRMINEDGWKIDEPLNGLEPSAFPEFPPEP